jgi:DNA (cytosine-5)-methyltransferase 1
MKHGSLFSGIGGFDLAADWMGWENIFHCEIAEFPRKILNHYWPNAECHEDIKKTDFTKYCGTVDIISGGFPCQPYSAAGKRLGKEDDRHLWPEMLRVIREVKPQWVVGENVRGLLNWNGGMVFHEVCADLENIGYEVQAFIIPASGINAPHQRERLWIVAHSNGNECNKRGQSINGREINKLKNGNEIWHKSTPDGKQRDATNSTSNLRFIEQKNDTPRTQEWEFPNTFNEFGKQRNAPNSDLHGFDERNSNDEINTSKRGFNALNDIDQSNGIGNAADTESKRTWEQSSENRGREDGRFNDISEDGDATDTDSIRLERKCGPIGELEREIRFSSTSSRNIWNTAWDNFPTKSPVCGGDDGISYGLDNITFSKWRNESIKGYGNAVVPQVVYRIFKTIEYIQNLKE